MAYIEASGVELEVIGKEEKDEKWLKSGSEIERERERERDRERVKEHSVSQSACVIIL